MKIVFISIMFILGQDLANAQDKPVTLCDNDEFYCGPDIGCQPCCQDSHCPDQEMYIGGGQKEQVERICWYVLFLDCKAFFTLLAFYVGTTCVLPKS